MTIVSRARVPGQVAGGKVVGGVKHIISERLTYKSKSEISPSTAQKPASGVEGDSIQIGEEVNDRTGCVSENDGRGTIVGEELVDSLVNHCGQALLELLEHTSAVGVGNGVEYGSVRVAVMRAFCGVSQFLQRYLRGDGELVSAQVRPKGGRGCDMWWSWAMAMCGCDLWQSVWQQRMVRKVSPVVWARGTTPRDTRETSQTTTTRNFDTELKKTGDTWPLQPSLFASFDQDVSVHVCWLRFSNLGLIDLQKEFLHRPVDSSFLDIPWKPSGHRVDVSCVSPVWKNRLASANGALCKWCPLGHVRRHPKREKHKWNILKRSISCATRELQASLPGLS